MSNPQYGSFDGYDASVSSRESGGSDIYYGGLGSADGDGHGHVVTNDAGSVEYWREPGSSSAAINDHAPEDNHTLW